MTRIFPDPGRSRDVDRVFDLFGEQGKAGCLVVDANRETVTISAGLCRLLSLAAQETALTADAWEHMLSPDSRTLFRELTGSPGESICPGVGELAISASDGVKRRIHLMTAPHPGLTGAVMGVAFEQGCCQEYEDREAVLRQKIRESEDFWTTIIDELQVGMWVWDIRNNRTVRTRNWNRLLGIKGDTDSQIADWEERIHPEDRETCASQLKDYFDNRTPVFECEYRVKDDSGQFHWVADRGKIIEWEESGEPARMCGVVVDISRQKQLESSLEAREHQFRAVFNSLFNFVGLLDVDGSVLECNQAVYELTGLPRDYMRGIPIWDGTWWVSAQTRKELPGWIRQAAAGEIVRREVMVAGMDGQLRVVDFSIKPVRYGEDGDIRWLVTEGREIGASASVPVTALEESVVPPLPPPTASESPCVAMIFPDGRFMSASHPFRLLVGFSEVELMGLNYLDITHPEEASGDLGFRQGLLDGDCESYTLETRFIHRDGQEVPVTVEVAMVRNMAGKPLYFTMRVRDLSPAWHEQTLRRRA